MKQVLLILLFMTSVSNYVYAYSSPFEPTAKELKYQRQQMIADSASGIANCFNGAVRTGSDYVQILKDCIATSARGDVVIKKKVADRASGIANCFNGAVRTGSDYIQILRDCMAASLGEELSPSVDLKYSEVDLLDQSEDVVY